MAGPPGQIGLKKIVGFDPDLQEFAHQVPDDFDPVIDPSQQNGLAAEGDTGVGQTRAGQL